ncbi:MAG: hypothetical protein GY842_09915 [bacterium]|nr:hypothetical protein [bacterium]
MFFHTNHLGTTRALTDDAGDVLGNASRLYTAFGNPVTAPTTPMTRYGFAGAWGYQALSAASVGSPQSSGLLHVGARYYDPALGRFLQRDPIGINGGVNVYSYVRSSPLLWVDPSGLQVGSCLGNQKEEHMYALGCAIANALLDGDFCLELRPMDEWPNPPARPHKKSCIPSSPWYQEFVDGLGDWMDGPYPF